MLTRQHPNMGSSERDTPIWRKGTPQQLSAVMAVSVVTVLVVAIWLLYEVSLEQQRQRLVEITQSRARLIEAISHHESGDQLLTGHDETLEQITAAHSQFAGFGKTGEFTMAKRTGDNIQFLLRHRHTNMEMPPPVPIDGKIAEPMRRALRGESGTLVGLDYRGVRVLAAHEPIKHDNWGIVAKIDMAELRAPFIKAAIFTTFAAAIIIVLGSLGIRRLLAPLMQQMQDDREYLHTLVKHSPIGLALCQMDGKLIDANPAFEAIIGRSLEEARSLSYWDITPDKYAMEEAARLRQLEQTGEYGPYEKEYIHKEGYLVPVRLSGKIILQNGQRYIWSSVEDISDRVYAEKRLRQAATVFDNTDEGIVISDENNHIVMVNNAFSEITGYSETEVLGQNPRLLQSGKHDQRFYMEMWQQLAEEGHWRGEMWNRRKDGSPIPVWQQISVLKDQEGKISNYVSTFSDISELKEAEQQLARLANHDELTGLPNRLFFKGQIEKSLQSAKRHQHRVALLYLDLDEFKPINDTYGHEAGDLVLRQVAERLQHCVREEDTVARVGGDEFVIILEQVHGPDDASLVAKHLISTVTQPLQLPETVLQPATSIGIAIYPDDAESVSELQKAADRAMYRAKQEGKNRYEFHTHHL